MEPINDFIHRLQSSGLINKWIDDRFQADIRIMSEEYKREANNEANNAKFSIPTVIWCGWIASGILFICEIIWEKVNSKYIHRLSTVIC